MFIVIICFNDCIYYEWLEKETYCYMDGKAVLYIEQCRYAICYRIMDQFENRLGRNSFFRPIATLLPQILLGPFTALLQTQVEPSFLGRVFSLFGGISLLSFGYRFVYNRNYWRFGRNSRGIIACGSAIVVIGISALFYLPLGNRRKRNDCVL